MATIALAAIGGFYGGAAGARIGAVVGAYIDQKYVFPALFPGKDIVAPKLGDFAFQTASEGAPINWCSGTEMRVSGNIIFISDFISTEHKKKVSGKGGGGSQYEKSYTYSVDMAVGVCEGEVDDIIKIWADGKLFYSADVSINITSSQIEAIKLVEKNYPKIDGQYGVSSSDPAVRRYLLILESPDGGPDLSQFISGNNVNVSGFTHAGNNDVWKCISANINTDTGVSQVELLADSGIDDEAAGDSITLAQSVHTYDPGEVDDIRIYKGTTTQTADSLLEDYEGAGEVPGYRGLAYIIFEGLQLRDFGNRVPSFSFLVKPSSSYNLQEAMTDLHERAGLTDSTDFDVSALDTTAVKGYNIAGPRSPIGMIKTLMLSYNLIAQVKNGILTYNERTDVDDITIDADDMAAHEEGQDVPRIITLLDKTGIDLPREVDVRFIEKALDYQQSNQNERLIESASDSVVGIDLPIVLTAAEARIIAKRELWVMWGTRQTVAFTLPPSQFDLLENDRVTVEAPTVAGTETYVILIREIARGFNRMLEIKGVIEHEEVLDQTASAEEPSNYDVSVFTPPYINMHLIDVAPLRNEDVLVAGFYYGECMEDHRIPPVTGAPANRRASSSSSWSDKRLSGHPENAPEASIGIATTVLGDRKTEFWDNENTVTIQLRNGIAESEVELEVLNGLNRIIIGDEIIGYQTATLIAPRTYTLSKLIRGLRNTEWATDKHVVNEMVMILTDANIIFHNGNVSAVGTEFNYVDLIKGSFDAEELRTYEYQANTLRPFAPCHIKGNRNASNDLAITWIRRTRAIIRHFSGNPTPVIDPREIYQFEIMDGATVVRVFQLTIAASTGAVTTRTIDGVPWVFQVLTAHAFTYSAANQTTDGLTPGDPVDVRAYQMSDAVGRGKQIEETV